MLREAGLKSYSSEMLKAGIKTFCEKRMIYYIVASLSEFAVKAIACRLGWYYQLMYYRKHDARR